MIEDFIKSFKATMYDRASSPLFGAFIFSWIAWNYKFILIISSSIESHQKISYIEDVIYKKDWFFWNIYWHTPSMLFIFPLLSATAFIYIYPWPAEWTFRFSREKQKRLNEIKQQIENEELLSVEKSRKLRLELTDIQLKFDNALKEKTERIEFLEESHSKVVSEKEVIKTEHSAILSRAKELENEIEKTRKDNIIIKKTTDIELKNILSPENSFCLVYNAQDLPKKSIDMEDASTKKYGAKTIRFSPDGTIKEGANENENRWDVRNGNLFFINKDGHDFSCFFFNKSTEVFILVNDGKCIHKKFQYMYNIKSNRNF